MLFGNDKTSGAKAYFSQTFVKVNLTLNLLLNVGLWLFLIWQVEKFSPLIPLHYNIYFGIDLLGPWYQIFLLPILGLAIFLFNLFLGIIFFKPERRLISYFLVGAATLVQLIILLAGLVIAILNW